MDLIIGLAVMYVFFKIMGFVMENDLREMEQKTAILKAQTQSTEVWSSYMTVVEYYNFQGKTISRSKALEMGSRVTGFSKSKWTPIKKKYDKIAKMKVNAYDIDILNMFFVDTIDEFENYV